MSSQETESTSWSCWIRTFTAMIGALGVTLFIGIIEAQSAVMIPQLRRADSPIRVTPDQETWIASLGVVMAPVSSLIIGPFIDAFGRKRGLQVFYFNTGLGFAVMACANNVCHIYIGRIICGLGSGFLSCFSVYLAEVCTKKQREIFFTILAGVFSSGLVIQNILSTYLLWHTISLIFSIVCFAFLFSQFFIPESPAWLFKTGNEDAAIRSYRRLGRNKAEIDYELENLKLSKSAHSAWLKIQLSQIHQEVNNLMVTCNFETFKNTFSQIYQQLCTLEMYHILDLDSFMRICSLLGNLKPSNGSDIVGSQMMDNLKLMSDKYLKSPLAQKELDALKLPYDIDLEVIESPHNGVDAQRLSNNTSKITSAPRNEPDNLKLFPVAVLEVLDTNHNVDATKLSNTDSKSEGTLKNVSKVTEISHEVDGNQKLSNTRLPSTVSEVTETSQQATDTPELSNTESKSCAHEPDTLNLSQNLENFTPTICQIHQELDNIALSHDTTRERFRLSSFFAPTVWKPFAIMVVFCILQSASGIYVIIFYSVDFIERLGTIYDPFDGSTLLSTSRFVSSATITVIFRSKIGRKFSTAFSALWMMVALVGVGVYEYILRDVSVAERPLQWLPIAFLVLYTAVMPLGLLTLPWAMGSEVYPLKVRGTMAGATNAVAFGLLFVSTKVYYSCVGALHIWGLLFAFASVAFVAVFFGVFVLPETQGKSLHEIEQGFLPEKKRRLSRSSRAQSIVSTEADTEK